MQTKIENNIDFSDLYNVLDFMKVRTGLFLLKRDLDLLYSFITGMKLTAIGNNVDLKNLEELDSFSKHIHEKLDIVDTNTMGWFGVIRDKHGSGEEGFNKFFEYFDQWRSGK